MRPAVFVILCIGLLGAAAGCGGEPEPRGAAAGMNVLLVVSDALRAGALGCYGSAAPSSPNIDALAREGVLVASCRTVVPETLPSFITMLTSRHPKDHGAFGNGMPPRGTQEFLGAVFQRAGYETAFFIASYYLDRRFGTAAGFDHFDNRLETEVTLPQNKLIRTAPAVASAFLEWLERRDDKRPYFAVVHFFEPHFPYAPPEELAREFLAEGEAAGTVPFEEIVEARERLRQSGGAPGPAEERLHRMYQAEVRHMDRELGRIIRALQGAEGGGRDTLVVFTADHGETFFEHQDYLSHGHTVYDASIRIPLIFWAPGVLPAARAVAEPRVSNIDLAPTLVELAGLEAPAGFAGRSFAGAVAGGGGGGREAPERDHFAEASAVAPSVPVEVLRSARPNAFNAKCVVRGPWKYIWTPHQEDREELYNLDADPNETQNLAGAAKHAPLISELRSRLRAWAHQSQAGAGAGTGAGREIPPDVLEKLRALGYAE